MGSYGQQKRSKTQLLKKKWEFNTRSYRNLLLPVRYFFLFVKIDFFVFLKSAKQGVLCF